MTTGALLLTSAVVGLAAAAGGCERGGRAAVPPGPDLQVVGESTATPVDGPVPLTSPYFDGTTIRVRLARGEAIGLQVLARGAHAITASLGGPPGATLRPWRIQPVGVTRPSTGMYGGSRGAGAYPDRLVPLTAAPATGPVLLDLAIAREAQPGVRSGAVTIDGTAYPLEVTVERAGLPPREARPWLWAYYDARELAVAIGAPAGGPAVFAAERACAGVFRAHGVLATPELTLANVEERFPLVRGAEYVPVLLPDDEAGVTAAVKGWIARLAGTGHVPFAIPVDEPATPAARARVRELAGWVRAAGGGPGRFLFAVTAAPSAADGGLVDVYISPDGVARGEPHAGRWTYNGKPPQAGNLVVDAGPAALRSWGAIAWRWDVPLWYVWDGLYWHDRHNRRARGEGVLEGAPLAAVDTDAVTFDNREDAGNLDGVLAYPGEARTGCTPSLRLVQLRRAVDDRALLTAVAACAGPAAADAIAATLAPVALADATKGRPAAWPSDDAAWEAARIRLLDALAACAARPAP